MASCVSEQVCALHGQSAVVFCPFAVIAPAVTNGDEGVNRLQPTDACIHCSLVATHTQTHLLQGTRVPSTHLL